MRDSNRIEVIPYRGLVVVKLDLTFSIGELGDGLERGPDVQPDSGLLRCLGHVLAVGQLVGAGDCACVYLV